MALAEWTVLALGAYAAAGLVFALCFAAWGVARIDPAAHGMPLVARLLVVPGAAALWPLMLSKWLRRQPPSLP